ncbi:MAG TPA: molybdopterin-guanine dinucleotide biosynthesis protein B [Acidobacteriota bacterium]|nr:molybdopterin-guanine dinucleotide biosynthesis protein B [Acidobacteriota bacterium]
MTRILHVVGCKNSGKTRFAELIVPVLKALDIQVGTLKHTEHDRFNWDTEGKDTYRHMEAGSDVTGIIGTGSFAFNFNRADITPANMDDIIRLFYRHVDLVLVEGLKSNPGLKVEVCRPGYSDSGVVPASELLATYGTDLFGYALPHFDYGREQELGQHIADNLGRLRPVTVT